MPPIHALSLILVPRMSSFLRNSSIEIFLICANTEKTIARLLWTFVMSQKACGTMNHKWLYHSMKLVFDEFFVTLTAVKSASCESSLCLAKFEMRNLFFCMTRLRCHLHGFPSHLTLLRTTFNWCRFYFDSFAINRSAARCSQNAMSQLHEAAEI